MECVLCSTIVLSTCPHNAVDGVRSWSLTMSFSCFFADGVEVRGDMTDKVVFIWCLYGVG